MDYRPALFGRGGIAVYVRELARALSATCRDVELRLWGHRFRRPPRPAHASAAPAGARLLAGPFPSRAQGFLARLGVGADRLTGGADVLHWTDFVELGATHCPVVATVHDVLFKELPRCYTAAMREGLDRITRRITRQAVRIVVPSPRSRDALVVHYGVARARVHVIPHGLPPLPDAPPAREHGDRYALHVGTLEPRKNLARLLRAHERAQRRGAAVKLVLAGARGWMDEKVLDAVAARDAVAWEENPSPARLAALYQGALFLAYPSLGEGFGLPVLEAMGAGIPALVGADTACADVGGDAVLAVEARDEDALAAAFVELACDDALRTRLGAHGLLRTADYTWERTAAATRAVYAEAMAS